MNKLSKIETTIKDLLYRFILTRGDYSFINGIHSVDFEVIENDSDEKSLGYRILLNVSDSCARKLPRNYSDYSKEEGGYLFYGMELEKRCNCRPYLLQIEINDLIKLVGIPIHPSLTGIYYIIKEKR